MNCKHEINHTEIKARAIELSGGRTALAHYLGITPNAISMWRRIPSERIGAVAAATAGQMTPSDLRPDIFASQ